MPIYEFVCSSCGNEFEKIMSFSSIVSPACPNCGAAEVERQMGRPAIHFKGSGWYITDSKNNSKESSNGVANKEKSENTDKVESAGKADGAASGATEGAATPTPAKSDSSPSTTKTKAEN